MVDFIITHFETQKPIPKSDKDIDFTSILHLNTGVISENIKGKLFNLKISLPQKKENSFTIQNSLHTFYNKMMKVTGGNYNDYSRSNIKSSIGFLMDTFKDYNVSSNYLTQLEFGFNIELPINASEFINKHIISYKNRTHNFYISNSNMCIKKFISENYELKFYDKGKESKLPQKNLLRVEIKHKGRRNLQAVNVEKLNDLYEKKTLNKLFNNLIKRVNDMVILDEIKRENRRKKNVEILIHHLNPYNCLIRSTSTLNRYSQNKTVLISELNVNTLHGKLKELLTEKFYYLLNS